MNKLSVYFKKFSVPEKLVMLQILLASSVLIVISKNSLSPLGIFAGSVAIGFVLRKMFKVNLF